MISCLQGLRRLAWAGLVLVFGAPVTEASPITWTFSDVKLTDGSSVTGGFTFDASTYVRSTPLTNFQVSISGGSVMPALLYTPATPLVTSLTVDFRNNPAGTQVNESVDAYGDRLPATPRLEFIFLALTSSLSDAGGTIPLQLTNSYGQLSNGEATLAMVAAVSGAVTGVPAAAVPEPSGPLCALGIMVLAACHRLGKRKL